MSFASEEMKKAVDLLWNGQVTAADEALDATKASDARAALHYAEVRRRPPTAALTCLCDRGG